MHAASRSALSRAIDTLTSVLGSAGEPVATAARTGTELFDCVEILDSDRALRVAVAESSTTGQQRAGLVRDVFGQKVSAATSTILEAVAGDTWSTPRELRHGLVDLGRRALLTAAAAENKLEQVENELFALSLLLEREPELTTLLTDRTAPAARKRGLLADVLYGKVAAVTEALVLQAIGRPEHGPIDDVQALSELAASLRGKTVARVVAATELSAAQKDAMAAKLGSIYGADMVIHSEVDPSLLGGAIVRVGSEVIDGSTSGRIERLRSAMVS